LSKEASHLASRRQWLKPMGCFHFYHLIRVF